MATDQEINQSINQRDLNQDRHSGIDEVANSMRYRTSGDKVETKLQKGASGVKIYIAVRLGTKQPTLST
jgi:hypothetical protein